MPNRLQLRLDSAMRKGSIMIQRIEHYSIECEVGRGGMGVVYRGHDERLGRIVAIKALPEDVAQDAGTLDRFEREARILATLNHPNIAGIHGMLIGPEGRRYLALEWVDGVTLDAHLTGRTISEAECLEIVGQIARGLEAAHEKGIIHRDLKPGNVMLDRRGGVKILDFGLARPLATSPDSAITSSGEVLGTPGYMSPEQIQGRVLDPRSDIFAFGALVFECLSGSPAFRGRTIGETVAAILVGEPNWKRLPEGVARSARNLLETCLRKEPSQRFQSMQDVGKALESWRRKEQPAPAPGGPSASRLPVPLTSFVGRRKAIEDCTVLLEYKRLVTLTGPGGCGKTRMALEVGRRISASGQGEVLLADLSTITDPILVPNVLAATLGVRDEAQEDLLDTISRAIGDRSLLLILDNCDSLVGAAGVAVTRTLSRCPGLRFLATSRQLLAVPGETAYRVGPLTIPAPEEDSDLDRVLQYESVRLFVERAQGVEGGFVIASENAGAVAGICRRLDGIPLAIELAAARTRVLSVGQIADRLQDRFRLLDPSGSPGDSGRRTLRGALQWSYDLLNEHEQRAFRAFSVFAGGFSLEAAVQLLRPADEYQALDLLSNLLDKSLLQSDEGPVRRYRYLETIREFGYDTLTANHEEFDARNAHLEFFAQLAERAEPELWGSEQRYWLENLELEHKNLLAALEWSKQTSASREIGLRLAGAIRRFWLMRGYYSLGRTLLEDAIAGGGGTPTDALGKALDGAGNLALMAGDYGAAHQWFLSSLATHDALRSAQGMARANTGLGHVHMQRSELPAARRSYSEGLRICRELGDRQGIAAALGNLGGVALVEGDLARAEDLMAESTDYFREMGNDHNLALALATAGVLATRRNAFETARLRLKECLPLIARLHAKRLSAAALEACAELCQGDGRIRSAVRLFAAAETLRVSNGMPLGPQEREFQEALIARLREQGGGDDFERWWSEGAALGLPEALQEATAACAERSS